jgi:hypothetical protein
VANVETPQPDSQHHESGAPEQVVVTRITTVGAYPVIETALNDQSKSVRHPDLPDSVATTHGGEMETARDRGEANDRDQDRKEQQADRPASRPTDSDRPQPARDANDRTEAHHQARHPSMMTNLLVTAAVSLTCGAIGAIGYTHFFGPTASDPSSSHSQTETPSTSESSSTQSGRGPATTALTQPGAGMAKIADEASELKQQIMNLNKRIERLGERVDRLQELLSLAVPLLQRIAPKH